LDGGKEPGKMLNEVTRLPDRDQGHTQRELETVKKAGGKRGHTRVQNLQ